MAEFFKSKSAKNIEKLIMKRSGYTANLFTVINCITGVDIENSKVLNSSEFALAIKSIIDETLELPSFQFYKKPQPETHLDVLCNINYTNLKLIYTLLDMLYGKYVNDDASDRLSNTEFCKIIPNNYYYNVYYKHINSGLFNPPKYLICSLSEQLEKKRIDRMEDD